MGEVPGTRQYTFAPNGRVETTPVAVVLKRVANGWYEPDPAFQTIEDIKGSASLADIASSSPASSPVPAGVADRSDAKVPGLEVRYLTSEQAATYLGVTPRFIRRLVEDAKVTVRKVGRYNRFCREDLDDAVVTVPARSNSDGDTRPLADDDPILQVLSSKRTLRNTGKISVGRSHKGDRP